MNAPRTALRYFAAVTGPLALLLDDGRHALTPERVLGCCVCGARHTSLWRAQGCAQHDPSLTVIEVRDKRDRALREATTAEWHAFRRRLAAEHERDEMQHAPEPEPTP